MGYVGLPLMLAAAAAGYCVVGFDVDLQKVETINSGKSYFKHIANDLISTATRADKLRATASFDEVKGVDAIIICVPTPLTRNREPDLTFIERTAKIDCAASAKRSARSLESTTWPGTTMEIVKPILERSGLRSGEDFFWHSHPSVKIPAIPISLHERSPRLLEAMMRARSAWSVALYGSIVDRVIAVSSTKTAEAVKLTENIFRAVNIALVNELKVIYDAMDIDVWEVIEAAKTKPFGFTPFIRDRGWGGIAFQLIPFTSPGKRESMKFQRGLLNSLAKSILGCLSTSLINWLWHSIAVLGEDCVTPEF